MPKANKENDMSWEAIYDLSLQFEIEVKKKWFSEERRITLTDRYGATHTIDTKDSVEFITTFTGDRLS